MRNDVNTYNWVDIASYKCLVWFLWNRTKCDLTFWATGDYNYTNKAISFLLLCVFIKLNDIDGYFLHLHRMNELAARLRMDDGVFTLTVKYSLLSSVVIMNGRNLWHALLLGDVASIGGFID